MTVNLSLLAGAGAQFFDNNGVILSGGLVYTYAAGTTTPQTAYTTSAGNVAHTNPIVLDSAGRVSSGGEIWLTQNQTYKFVLKTSASITVGTYDNISGSSDPGNIYAAFAASSGSSLIGYLPAGANAVATTVQTKLRESVSVADFGAVGDNSTDDTTPIQNAIDYAVANGVQLNFAAKTYKITAPLTVGSATPNTSGSFQLAGERASVVNNFGTRIVLYGTGFSSIIEWKAGAFRNCGMSGITLSCNTVPTGDVYSATAGIYFSQTAYSGLHFEDLQILNCRYAIYIVANGYANGEFNTYTHVTGGNVQKFFVMASGTGQAYGHMFYSCNMGASVSQGSSEYVLFDLGDSNGGYNLYCLNFNATISGTTTSTTHAATYFKNGGVNGPVYFKGGRIEGLTTLTANNCAAAASEISFEDIDFAGVYSTSTNPLISSTTISYGNVSFRQCSIPIVDTALFNVVLNTADRFRYNFDRCSIGKYSGNTAFQFAIYPSNNGVGLVAFNDCLVRRSDSTSYEILNKTYIGVSGVSLSSNINDSNSVISGTPENFIKQANFGAATPTSPWVSSSAFSVYQTSGSNINTFSGSPYAVYLQMAAGLTIYQDIFSVTAANQAIHYLASVAPSVANTTDKLQIQLSNPTTGEIYDTVVFGDSISGAPIAISIVKLDALTTGATGTVRLTWSTPSSNSAVIPVLLDWQTASSQAQLGYVNTTTATVSYSHPWGNVGNLRAFGRMSIPYIPRTAVGLESLPNVESDLAISSTSNRLIYYANSHGNELPNQDVGTAFPTTGTWPAGWIRWNSAPAASGTIGWVCVTAGTSGTWKTFGAISA
jgi:hypothetical protein